MWDKQITCPYCGYEEHDSQEWNDSDSYTCGECGEESNLAVDFEVTYFASKKEIKK